MPNAEWKTAILESNKCGIRNCCREGLTGAECRMEFGGGRGGGVGRGGDRRGAECRMTIHWSARAGEPARAGVQLVAELELAGDSRGWEGVEESAAANARRLAGGREVQCSDDAARGSAGNVSFPADTGGLRPIGFDGRAARRRKRKGA